VPRQKREQILYDRKDINEVIVRYQFYACLLCIFLNSQRYAELCSVEW
jgi:hypothetical protein